MSAVKICVKIRWRTNGNTGLAKPDTAKEWQSEEKETVQKVTEADADMAGTYGMFLIKLQKVSSPEDFPVPLYQRVAQMLFEQQEEGQVNPAKLLNAVLQTVKSSGRWHLFLMHDPSGNNRNRKGICRYISPDKSGKSCGEK